MKTVTITCDACGDVVGEGGQTVGARDICGPCDRAMHRLFATPVVWAPIKAEQVALDKQAEPVVDVGAEAVVPE